MVNKTLVYIDLWSIYTILIMKGVFIWQKQIGPI